MRYFIDSNGTKYTGEHINGLWCFTSEDYNDSFRCITLAMAGMKEITFKQFAGI